MSAYRISLHDKVVNITRSYLGPAAERFIDRQIENHLHKTPANLTVKDLLKLITWIRLAVSMLTEDAIIVDEYVKQLEKLAKKSQAGK